MSERSDYQSDIFMYVASIEAAYTCVWMPGVSGPDDSSDWLLTVWDDLIDWQEYKVVLQFRLNEVLTHRLTTRPFVTYSHNNNKICQTGIGCEIQVYKLALFHLPRQDPNVNRPENEPIDYLVCPTGRLDLQSVEGQEMYFKSPDRPRLRK